MRELKKWGSKEKGARRRSPLRFPPSQHTNEKVRSEKQKKNKNKFFLEDQRWENWVKDSPLKTQNSKLKNQKSKLKTQKSKLKNQNSKIKTQN